MRAKLVTYKGKMIKIRRVTLLQQLTVRETMFSLATSESYYIVWHSPEAVTLSVQRLDERSCIALYQREAQMLTMLCQSTHWYLIFFFFNAIVSKAKEQIQFYIFLYISTITCCQLAKYE